MSIKELVEDLAAKMVDEDQNQQLARHRRHIRALWRHLELIEDFISAHRDGSITLAVGQASITLKKNGDIALKGHNIDIRSTRRITIKGEAEVIIKGDKILQN